MALTNKRIFSLPDLVLIPLMAAMMVSFQYLLSFLPNIEVVSLLVMVFAVTYGWKVIPAIYIFSVLEGLLYGFSVWWLSYLYVWTILAVLAILCKKQKDGLFWAILSGGFGLAFGALCEIPWIFISGPEAAFAAFLSGLLFDVLHCVGNFVAALLLFVPLRNLLEKLFARLGRR